MLSAFGVLVTLGPVSFWEGDAVAREAVSEFVTEQHIAVDGVGAVGSAADDLAGDWGGEQLEQGDEQQDRGVARGMWAAAATRMSNRPRV